MNSYKNVRKYYIVVITYTNCKKVIDNTIDKQNNMPYWYAGTKRRKPSQSSKTNRGGSTS